MQIKTHKGSLTFTTDVLSQEFPVNSPQFSARLLYLYSEIERLNEIREEWELDTKSNHNIPRPLDASNIWLDYEGWIEIYDLLLHINVLEVYFRKYSDLERATDVENCKMALMTELPTLND